MTAGNAKREITVDDVRWLVRADMDEVLEIERRSFDHPWTEHEWITAMCQRNCIGRVALHSNRVVGSVVYELHRDSLRIINLAVSPEIRRCGVGRQMVQLLFRKLSTQRRRWLEVDVRETNLAAQMFFKSMGFRAVGVRRNAYSDTDESAYEFEFDVGASGSKQTEETERRRQITLAISGHGEKHEHQKTTAIRAPLHGFVIWPKPGKRNVAAGVPDEAQTVDQ